MRIRPVGKVLIGCLLPAAMFLGGCDLEHSQEPWVNSGQRELVEGELERDPEVAEKLRDRLTIGQADR